MQHRKDLFFVLFVLPVRLFVRLFARSTACLPACLSFCSDLVRKCSLEYIAYQYRKDNIDISACSPYTQMRRHTIFSLFFPFACLFVRLFLQVFIYLFMFIYTHNQHQLRFWYIEFYFHKFGTYVQQAFPCDLKTADLVIL